MTINTIANISKLALAAVLGLFLISGNAEAQEGQKKQANKTSQVTKSKWVSETHVDKMTSKNWYTSSVTSTNSLNLDFPYQGRNKGELIVRKNVRGGDSVMISVDKGQILCSGYDGCTVTVRFDDDEPVHFDGVGAADYDSKVVFIKHSAPFIEKAINATRILVSVRFYRHGDQILQFNTGLPLTWTETASIK